MESRRIGLKDLRDDELSRAVGRLLTLRVFFFPISLSFVTLFVFLDPALWRRFVVLPFLPAAFLFAVLELRRYRLHGLRRSTITVNVAAQIAILSVIVVLTGGVRSVLTTPVIVVTQVQAVLLPPRPAGRFTAATAVFFAALGGVQAFAPLHVVRAMEFGGEMQGAGVTMTLLRTVLLLLFLGVGQAASRIIRGSFESVATRALAARDEALQSYSNESQTLTTLAGEIAHELKNPLASIKGLAGLLGKDATGPHVECVGVMRGEIDRMQSILEEFLNFSRPLVPLTQREVDICALCADATVLHEGLAAARGVRIRVEGGGGLVIRCDGRKVKQILVNLLQNAIAASPEGGEIVVRTAAAVIDGVPSVRVLVEDQGKGLAPEIAARLFTPGATTKSGGSGLGLTVSRAIARQHGGDLTLRNLALGCAGELVLPREGARPREAT